jgi:hypothetical protein
VPVDGRVDRQQAVLDQGVERRDELDAGRAATDDDERQQRLAYRKILLDVGALERFASPSVLSEAADRSIDSFPK